MMIARDAAIETRTPVGSWLEANHAVIWHVPFAMRDSIQ
jgi:hypothetical protein